MRAIDGDKLLEQLQKKKAGPANKRYTEGFNDCLMRVRSMVHSMPTLTPPNEWVSVEERLPEVGQEVLVYWRNTSQKAEHFELTHYDGGHWFLLDNTERPWIVVVAWMPLPKSPKEDE